MIKRICVLSFIVAVVAMGGCCNAINAAVMSNGNDAVSGYWADPAVHPDTMRYGILIYSHDHARDLKDGKTVWYSYERNDDSPGPVFLGICKKLDDTHYQLYDTYAYSAADDDWRFINQAPVVYQLVKRNNVSYLYSPGEPSEYALKRMGDSQYTQHP